MRKPEGRPRGPEKLRRPRPRTGRPAVAFAHFGTWIFYRLVFRVVPEIEHLLERRQEVAGIQTDFGSHVVTVTHVPDLTRTMEEDVDEDGEKVESGAAPTTAPVSSKKAVRAANRELTRKINSNKLVQRAQKIKSKSSKNKSRVLKGKKTQKTKRNRHHHPNKRST